MCDYCLSKEGGLARGSTAPSNSCSSFAASPTTTSTSIIVTINGSQHFTTNGYSLSKGMGVGKYIANETFVVGGYEWAIYFYPDDKSAKDNSLYVFSSLPQPMRARMLGLWIKAGRGSTRRIRTLIER